MKSNWFVRLVFLAALLAILCSGSVHAAQPNIIVILADDAGYADFGFQGGGINGDFAALAPNLDSLATNGVKFTSGYVSGPVCCPSRAGLLTGRYQQRFGMEQNIQNEPNAGLATSESTLANRLKALGYRTYALGKWHLGQDLPEHHPNQRGFDEFFGFLSGARTYFQFAGVSAANKLQSNGVFVAESPTQYLTDVLGAAAANYISTHVTNHPAQPFFMYLAFNGVHAPLEANAARLADPRIQSITNTNRKTLAAMTIGLDDATGVVMNKLAQLGLATNTLVVFLNDNGGPEDAVGGAPNWSDNGPLRGNKQLLYEGGIRVPFVMSWPGGIPSAPGGRVLDDPVISLDLLPTFIAAAGGSLFPGVATDGVNLLPRVTGAVTNPIQRALFWRTGGSAGDQSAVRKGDWKLFRGTNQSPELYNLATDLGESNNLAAAFPDKVAELVAAHAEWERGMIEPLWGGGAPTLSSASLTYRASSLGLELEKTGTGYAYLLSERRVPLSLSNDWSLAWSMESVAVAGYARNGFIVLGDGLSTANLIRIGLSFGTGTMSITETASNAGHGSFVGNVPAGVVNEFRVDYAAATRTLTLRFGTNVVSHTLTGTYGDLDYSGYAIQSSCLTRFSPVNLYAQPVAPGTSPTWARMKLARDYVPGSYDTNSQFMGGTELMSLVAHQGKLYAGVGYWNDVYFGAGSPDPHPGAQVLVKDAWNAPWRHDAAFGSNHLRVECLRSITFHTYKTGTPLNPPVTLLLAGSGEISTAPPPRRATVFVRNDINGTWTPTHPGSAPSGTMTTRMVFDHMDKVTGIHHAFCGFGSANNAVVRGGYNAATGLIDWESATPELEGSERMLSAGECNGILYACIGSDGNFTNNIGGVFWREDGPSPQWHFVYEWPVTSQNPDIRGFTAVPHPKGFGYDVALVTLESFGKVYCLDPVGGDPRNGHVVTEELNIQQFLGDAWNGGASIGFPTLSAYNDMPEVIHPGTGQPVNLVGLGVGYPAPDNSPERNSAYYLIRHRNATYEWGRVFDPAIPVPNPTADGLRATRAIRLSPFAEDRGRVLFFGGFDAASQTGPVWHNTAWLYRAQLPDETAQIQRTGASFTLGTDTAHGWQYQLQYTPDFTQWFNFGGALNGNNTPQSLLVTPSPGIERQFYRWSISRP